jgi:hypothetical protein
MRAELHPQPRKPLTYQLPPPRSRVAARPSWSLGRETIGNEHTGQARKKKNGFFFLSGRSGRTPPARDSREAGVVVRRFAGMSPLLAARLGDGGLGGATPAGGWAPVGLTGQVRTSRERLADSTDDRVECSIGWMRAKGLEPDPVPHDSRASRGVRLEANPGPRG